jgi:hypothetical protein
MLATARKCDCGWVTWHQINWCPACGSVLKIIRIDTFEYYTLSKKFVEDTGWQWSNCKYDPNTGNEINLHKNETDIL